MLGRNASGCLQTFSCSLSPAQEQASGCWQASAFVVGSPADRCRRWQRCQTRTNRSVWILSFGRSLLDQRAVKTVAGPPRLPKAAVVLSAKLRSQFRPVQKQLLGPQVAVRKVRGHRAPAMSQGPTVLGSSCRAPDCKVPGRRVLGRSQHIVPGHSQRAASLASCGLALPLRDPLQRARPRTT